MSSAAGPDPSEAPEERRFLSTAEAAALERELLEDYRFGRQQLVELCGHASAVAVTKAFPLPALSRKQRTVLVVCGPEQNGAVGLVCARHLRVFEYEPTIFYPMRSLDLLHRDLTTQCEKMDIPFLSYLPTEVSAGWQVRGTWCAVAPSRPDPACHPQVQLINEAYGLVVDAVLGPGVEPGEVGAPCTRALATLKLLSIPLVSLDIPSGMPGRGGHNGAWRAWVESPVPQLLADPACLNLSPQLGWTHTWLRLRVTPIPQMGKIEAATPGDPRSPPSPTPVPSPHALCPPLAQSPGQT
uniref:NADH:ubiquinone oxidoreductase subunit A13 n=1 Tax=Macaca fascicularis TaxID=9541 RepID=A0A7N9CH43_MACFA